MSLTQEPQVSQDLPAKEPIVTDDVEAVEKPLIEVEHIEGTVRLYDANGNVRKIPIPTDDPNDPLTWPSWKRWLIMGALCIYGMAGFGVVQSTPLFFGSIIGEYEEQTQGQFNPEDIAQLASYPSLCLGLGNFLFVPLSMWIGRRPVFIFNNLLMLASIIWAAKSVDFTTHLAARCLQGLSCGIGDCLLPLMVLDITFLHRRGFWMSFYWACVATGSTALLVSVPFIVESANSDWRINYYFWAAFSGLSLLIGIFFLPETLFARPPALIDGQIAITDSYGNVTFVAPEEAPALALETGDATPKESTPPSGSPYLRIFKFHTQKNGFKKFYLAYVEMFLALLHPSIFYVVLLNSLLFAGIVAQSLTYSNQLVLPPWNFPPSTVGTVQAGSAIGSVVAFALSGSTVDKVSGFLTRRHNGIREPEHLLPNFILPCLLAFGGLVLYGVVAGNPPNFPGGGWIGVHVSFGMYYCGFVAISAISGVWIGEVLPHWSGPALVLVTGGRNIVAFAITNNFTVWIISQGFQNAYIELSGAFIAVAILGGVPLFFYNKAIRRTWGKRLRFDAR